VSAPPVVVLGVWRSGTTLLKEILDHHSRLAIPGESNFLPGLWVRWRARPDVDRILADVDCVPQLREWGVRAADIRTSLPERPSFSDVVRALYQRYADDRGKPRFGDRTPHYMRHLKLLEHAFDCPRYVHIVRDGRDAALSFAGIRARRRPRWIWPRGIVDFACRWREEVAAARGLGATVGPARYLELRYEDLVRSPESIVRDVCAFLDLPFESGMLEFHRRSDLVADANHRRLAEPVSPGGRDWRREMSPADVRSFEAIAGPLLGDLGYERSAPAAAFDRARCLPARAASRARLATAIPVPLFRRSFLWRVRQRQRCRRLNSARTRAGRARS